MMRVLALLCVLFFSTDLAAATSVPVTASGNVQNPGSHLLPADSRLSRLLLTADPTEDAYMLGAALLRERARIEQTRWKAGLLFDLEQLSRQHQNSTELSATLLQMTRSFARMPVTGRVSYPLEPRALEASRENDLPAQAGDHVFYPARPGTITLTGAVMTDCQPAHVALQSPANYLKRCATSIGASPDHVHVIQADGHVERLGIAAWNRDAPSSLAPGAIIFIPLADAVVRKAAPRFNEDAARFLATQLLPAPGTAP